MRVTSLQHNPQNPRHQAVALRESGTSLEKISKQTGLSKPTVIALYKDFKSGGWSAVEGRRVGRPRIHKDDKPNPDIQSKLRPMPFPPKEFGAIDKPLWDCDSLANWLTIHHQTDHNARSIRRLINKWGWLPNWPTIEERPKLNNPKLTRLQVQVQPNILNQIWLIISRGPRGELLWLTLDHPPNDLDYIAWAERLLSKYSSGVLLNFQFAGLKFSPHFKSWLSTHPDFQIQTPSPQKKTPPEPKKMASSSAASTKSQSINPSTVTTDHLTHLQRLEAESIHIMREVVASCDNPVMLYSIGKDSACMLHLALKAFYPAKLPFPLMHVDTTWKFKDMYAFRDKMQAQHDFKLITHINQEGLAKGINPFTHGSQIHTDIMKTQGLKQALDHHRFDAAFGGARRDEEKSRAKERIFSFRTAQHRWDPKNQRPELWNLYNTHKHKGESLRVFPISNWTELDIWQYIYLENIPIVPLYFAKERPVVDRDGSLIMVDDERMPLHEGEVPLMRKVRFRTLGCYPLTGAVESQADTLTAIIQEMLLTTTSERQGRVIDHDGAASMEKKKQEGYF